MSAISWLGLCLCISSHMLCHTNNHHYNHNLSMYLLRQIIVVESSAMIMIRWGHVIGAVPLTFSFHSFCIRAAFWHCLRA
jgi:hypothetical protein